jgi:protein ImuA
MPENKNDIIRDLYRKILPLQGYREPSSDVPIDFGLGPIQAAFPNGNFPRGAIHDFLSSDQEQDAATCAFISGILGTLMERGGVSVWIGPPGVTYARGMALYGLEAHRVIFVTAPTPLKALWVMEESLRCDRFIAVVGEIPDLSFIASRRLQLAVEQSRVTGFLLRHQSRQKHPVASVAQWRITGIPTQSQDGRPGRGFPRWRVELLKIRNRQPNACEIEWMVNHFNPIEQKESESSHLNLNRIKWGDGI